MLFGIWMGWLAGTLDGWLARWLAGWRAGRLARQTGAGARSGSAFCVWALSVGAPPPRAVCNATIVCEGQSRCQGQGRFQGIQADEVQTHRAQADKVQMTESRQTSLRHKQASL